MLPLVIGDALRQDLALHRGDEAGKSVEHGGLVGRAVGKREDVGRRQQDPVLGRMAVVLRSGARFFISAMRGLM